MGNIEPWSTPEDRFGRSVRREREAAGLSQKELADRLKDFGVNLHASAIAKIEARDSDSPRSIRLDEAGAIARALGTTINALVGAQMVDVVYAEAADLAEDAAAHAEASQKTLHQAFDVLREGLTDIQFKLWNEGDLPANLARERNRFVEALVRIEKANGPLGKTDGEHSEA